ncbi:F-box protein CPR1-like [Apium graveolens]|uniref:F-box protein CPR1-like n=1 Tax=Apium graveolens TaxID=4045 RepID=UPI003D7AA4B5
MKLPGELVDEILTRVPVKYLLRCRCVSKEWCCLIDSTEFVENYLKMCVERNRGGVIVRDYDLAVSSHKYFLVDVESLDNGGEVIVDISEEVKEISDGAMLIDSVNGLVCLSNFENISSIFLLNPCTRKYKKLPVVGKEFLDDNNLSGFATVGFGYDDVSDDYKVVMTALCNKPARGIMAIVYSLKKNSWTLIAEVFSTEKIKFIGCGKFADGLLRYKAFDVTGLDFFIDFDLGLEKFTEPRYWNNKTMQLEDISIGKSQYEEMLANPVFKSFRCPKLLMNSKDLSKILLEIFEPSRGRRFVWHDFRRMTFEIVTIPGISNAFNSERYIESLFPLIEL